LLKIEFRKVVVAEALAAASAWIEFARFVGRFCETPIALGGV
jgi:hypothetical protein